MKKLLSIAFIASSIAASTPAAKAFTFDFSGVAIGPLPVVVNVAGYGSVTVALVNSTAVIGTTFGAKTLEFGPRSVVSFTFPTPVTNGSFTFIDLDTNAGNTDKVTVIGDDVAIANGVNFAITDATANGGPTVVSNAINSGSGYITISSSNLSSFAGLQQVDFIPEPSSALLAGIGALVMFVRRRR